jgi:hypothetical protein
MPRKDENYSGDKNQRYDLNLLQVILDIHGEVFGLRRES